MSRADRIVRRRQWRDKTLDHHWHEWSIAEGYRHPSFQARKRKAREELGLPETSTDMHRAHGRAI